MTLIIEIIKIYLFLSIYLFDYMRCISLSKMLLFLFIYITIKIFSIRRCRWDVWWKIRRFYSIIIRFSSPPSSFPRHVEMVGSNFEIFCRHSSLPFLSPFRKSHESLRYPFFSISLTYSTDLLTSDTRFYWDGCQGNRAVWHGLLKRLKGTQIRFIKKKKTIKKPLKYTWRFLFDRFFKNHFLDFVWLHTKSK